MPPKAEAATKNPPAEDVEVEDAEKATEENENALTSDTVTKYQTAAEIANRALTTVIAAAADGVKVIDLCKLGDATILEGVKGVYAKKKGLAKGIAFPTSVSPSSAICHLSPIDQDAEAIAPLKAGELVRIELGVHIDGYIAMGAQTIVVGSGTKEAPITGRPADVMSAAYYASEAALRLMKPGKTNYEVTEAIEKIAADFGCKPVQGMMSHQLQRNVLDGKKRIILNPTEQQKKDTESITFEEGDVFSLDILISTGDGIPKPLETHRTTIFKKVPDASYALKTATARGVYTQVKKDFGEMAFSIRQFEEQTKARLGLVECSKHGLVMPYQVYYEKEAVDVAHLMMTVLLMPTGPLKITGLAWDAETVKSDKEIQDEGIKELLKQPVRSNKSSKKKKKAAGDKEEK
ncbi:Proliferation-associated protein 2G4 [Blyttiomyces sp. JEL0837]|nr:Proliferation-associated protein 2G4 [Blyttiomyces sp. JEL0837]